jgi:hypothetical protein
VAMAAVLSTTGLFLYTRLGSTLDETIDQGLRSPPDRLAEAAELRGHSGEHLRRSHHRPPLSGRASAETRIMAATHGRVRDAFL